MNVNYSKIRDSFRKPVVILLVSLFILGAVVFSLGYYFNRSDAEKFSEKKREVITNFETTLNSYHSLLTVYGHLFSQLYERELLTTSNTFQSSTFLENRREIRAIGYYTVTSENIPNVKYLDRFGIQSSKEIGDIINSLDLISLSQKAHNNENGFIYKINANYILYIEEVDQNTLQDKGYIFLLINQQDIFRMLSQISPEYIEYRIYNVKDQPTPVYTHKMKDNLYYFFTRTRATAKEVVEFESFTWVFLFYFYDSSYEVTQFIIVLLMMVLGLSVSLLLYWLSIRNYNAFKQARHLENLKDEFIAIASHELKTPLTSIKALNQILAEKMDVTGNALYESFFRKMDTQIQRMENLINDLLDVSRIRSGKLSYKMDYFDLEQVVRTVSDDIGTISRSHKVTVNGSITKNVYGDKDRITQVVTNILINAAKYSPQANLIMVTMSENENEAIIAIQDFGIGISRDSQKRIFERFYRVSTDEHKYKGLGIGLFISSEIVRKHGGKIWTKSKKNKGATFYFTIPFKSSF